MENLLILKGQQSPSDGFLKLSKACNRNKLRQCLTRFKPAFKQKHGCNSANLHKFSINYISTHKHILAKFITLATDQKRRSAFERCELNRRLLKSVIHGNVVFKAQELLQAEPAPLGRLALVKAAQAKIYKKPGTLTTVRNRCVLSGHKNTVSKLGFSRLCFRHLACMGKIPGLIKI